MPGKIGVSEQVLIEVCVDSAASAMAAERGGANRVELCSSLGEGGVTPSLGLLEVVRQKVLIGLHVIVRPRGGDFLYDQDEVEAMRRDIVRAKNSGADGVVFGILDADGNVDVERTRQLVELARPMSVTFHRAFDMSSNLLQALEDVCTSGADRILTSGAEASCEQGEQMIAQLVRAARGRVTIMAAGGIRHNNVAGVIERTRVREIHVGLSAPAPSPMIYRNARVSLGRTRDGEYQRWQVLEETVRELRRSIPGVK
jgi:copper homeostasis protein